VCQEDDETDNIIRRATNSSRPFGSETFIDMLEFQLNQTLKLGKPGRPRKENRGVFD
jgi:putative transposase